MSKKSEVECETVCMHMRAKKSKSVCERVRQKESKSEWY